MYRLLKTGLVIAAATIAAPACAEQTWTHVLPQQICTPLAPDNGCQTTQPLDLTDVTKFRVSVQLNNFTLGAPGTPAVITLRDTTNMSSPCFGATCPTLTISPEPIPHGSCCAKITQSALILVSRFQRRNGVRLRLESVGGNLLEGNSQPAIIQFYKN